VFVAQAASGCRWNETSVDGEYGEYLVLGKFKVAGAQLSVADFELFASQHPEESPSQSYMLRKEQFQREYSPGIWRYSLSPNTHIK